MEKIQHLTEKLYTGLLAILLTVIGFFLVATYNKISETNAMVYKLQIELASIKEHSSQFMNFQQTDALIDKKILQYHKDVHN